MYGGIMIITFTKIHLIPVCLFRVITGVQWSYSVCYVDCLFVNLLFLGKVVHYVFIFMFMYKTHWSS